MSQNHNKDWGGKKPKFTPRNPHKYLGDPDNIVIRSSWERTAFAFCDNNIRILGWSSEDIIIPYLKPIFSPDGKMRTKMANYYPDLYVEYVNPNGELIKELIEIKPKKQTRISRAKNYTTNLYENMMYAVNLAKWDAATKWCMQRGIAFKTATEDSLFKKTV